MVGLYPGGSWEAAHDNRPVGKGGIRRGHVAFSVEPEEIERAAAFLQERGIASRDFFFAAVLWRIPETKPAERAEANSGDEGWREAWRWREHPSFLLTLLCVPMSLLYGQADTNLPIRLKDHFADYQKVFAVMMR